MGNVINLKEAVLDYKPGQASAELRLHALEVLLYIEKLEKEGKKPEIVENNISFCDFAILHNAI